MTRSQKKVEGAMSDPVTTWPDTVPSISNERINELAVAMIESRIFYMQHIRNPHDVPSVFMGIALGGFSGAPQSYIDSIGTIYEYMEKRGPLCVNGLPTFFSFNIVNKDDWAKAVETYERMKSAIEQQKTPPTDRVRWKSY